MDKEAESNIAILLKETQQSSYFEKCTRWKNLLSKTSPDDYLYVLNKFLDYFPFNYEEWMQYISLTSPSSYLLALQRNPKSYQLWDRYLEHLRQNNDENQGYQKYKKEVSNAIREIGADVRTTSLYTQYYGMLEEKYHYDFYKNIFTRALMNLEKIYEKFQEWLETLPEEKVQIIVAKQTKGRQLMNTDGKTFIKEEINKVYKKTLKYRQIRVQLEGKIKHFYFNGNQEQLEEDMKVWRQLIEVQRANGAIENTSYCYERMLMAQTHSIELWEEVFHYLQNETNKYSKVLNIFRYNQTFFVKFNVDLYLYWCDLEERENPSQTRKMYIELEKHHKKLQVYLRHIQFQIREKQWDNAKTLFDTLVVENQTDLQKIQLLCYILIEYTNYVIKYYKDYDYPKKLLKEYFQYLPYNDYLFTNYLQFMRNYQNKEGYYDDLMEVIVLGLRKAKSSLHDDEFSKVVKMVKHYLRSVLSSIYLIKMSERRMMEFDEKNAQNTM